MTMPERNPSSHPLTVKESADACAALFAVSGSDVAVPAFFDGLAEMLGAGDVRATGAGAEYWDCRLRVANRADLLMREATSSDIVALQAASGPRFEGLVEALYAIIDGERVACNEAHRILARTSGLRLKSA